MLDPHDVDKLVRCIRKIEEDPHEYLGDRGQAAGPWQFHPAAFWQWCERPLGNWTWEKWFETACYNFVDAMLQAFPSISPEEIAVVYHRHCYITRAKPGDATADDYLTRFQHAWQEDTSDGTK